MATTPTQGTPDAPHWRVLLDDLWDEADGETFELIDVRDYATRNNYDEETLSCVLGTRPTWDYLEWGVSSMYPWFHSEWDGGDAWDERGGKPDYKRNGRPITDK